MTVTISVKSKGQIAFKANTFAVDLGYFWARTFFEELGLNIDPNNEGMIGEHPILDFNARCKNYKGPSESYAKRIVSLCTAGIKEGATRVFWC